MDLLQDEMLYFKQTARAYLILLAVILLSCGRNSEAGSTKKAAPGNELISMAERLSLRKSGNLTIVTVIDPWQGANGVNSKYYLVPRGTALPAGLDSSQVIFVPVKKIICMSTTHVAMISALGEENSIAGMSGTGFIYSKSLNERVKRGLIEDVGYEANLNKELILKIKPDLVMIYGIGSESAGYVGKIQELGVKVVYNADYLETDALRKAEWIKLFGALYCREGIADSIFDRETATYNDLKSYISGKVSYRPEVLLGLPFRDTWFVSPGNSFISALIGDAGGSYLWKDSRSALSMPLGLENVYLKALGADYWLNIGTARTKSEITAVDQRLGELPCFKKGNLYNNNKRISPEGGNDFWESGAVYPHLILKDMATIFHPDLFADRDLFFYNRIE